MFGKVQNAWNYLGCNFWVVLVVGMFNFLKTCAFFTFSTELLVITAPRLRPLASLPNSFLIACGSARPTVRQSLRDTKFGSVRVFCSAPHGHLAWHPALGLLALGRVKVSRIFLQWKSVVRPKHLACSPACLTASWLLCGPRGDLELVWLFHVYEAGSSALPCDTSPPSPVAPSLHRTFLAGVASPSTLWATTKQREGLGKGMGSREHRSSHLP